VTPPTNDNNTCETLCELMNNHFFVQPYENTNMLSYQEIQKTQPPERPSLSVLKLKLKFLKLKFLKLSFES